MDKIAFYGALIVFIILIVLRSKRNFKKKALHFPFTLTLLGDSLYFFLILFLIINFGIDLLFVSRVDICINHYGNININSAMEQLFCLLLG